MATRESRMRTHFMDGPPSAAVCQRPRLAPVGGAPFVLLLGEVRRGGEDESREFAILVRPSDSGGRHEVEAGEELFDEVAGCEHCAAVQHLDEDGGDRGPYHICEIADARDDVAARPD
eukprot:CAMPEP_0197387080 /NCGR_PEP_ID=MMETSP1165-20131217/309_1 /TAXON_ID=284809 /ORGANISM="Chrysocystis fragilis, Strain CCMP3189" /LENGTH=117 /DNA_ID=CAMNT_0042912379 /DNA_START=59 /DNA_END=412 /DNA_ORIENTATION=+